MEVNKQLLMVKSLFILLGILCAILILCITFNLWFDVDSVNYGNYMMLIPGIEALLALSLTIYIFVTNKWNKLVRK